MRCRELQKQTGSRIRAERQRVWEPGGVRGLLACCTMEQPVYLVCPSFCSQAPGGPRPPCRPCFMSLTGVVMGRNWTFTYPQISLKVNGEERDESKRSWENREGGSGGNMQHALPARLPFVVPCSLPTRPVHPRWILAVFKVRQVLFRELFVGGGTCVSGSALAPELPPQE